MVFSGSLFAQNKKVKFVQSPSTKEVKVMVDGKYFTSYFYPSEDVLKKPVLNPINSAFGTEVTRGWPLNPRSGERVDHPHHVGMWLNFEDVNNHDYWNNSKTPPRPGALYGTILHESVKVIKAPKNQGKLLCTATWVDSKGQKTLSEVTEYTFYGIDNQRFVERKTTLTAIAESVLFKDVKDGFFAIRVARQLEHPSQKAEVFTDANGVATAVPVLDNTGVVGKYLSSEGIEGEDVWGKRAKWMNLRGEINGEKIALVIFDHPQNVNYPAYWHARGYGLFAVNPLGTKVFSNGKEETNLTLKAGQSTTFKYKVMLAQEPTVEQINAEAVKFDKK
jgi:hypothetical protein